MSYRAIWSQSSRRSLEAIDGAARRRIIAKVEGIKEQPYNYVKHLVGVSLYSLRIEDYRVILDIKNEEMLIFVVRLGRRSNVYNRL